MIVILFMIISKLFLYTIIQEKYNRIKTYFGSKTKSKSIIFVICLILSLSFIFIFFDIIYYVLNKERLIGFYEVIIRDFVNIDGCHHNWFPLIFVFWCIVSFLSIIQFKVFFNLKINIYYLMLFCFICVIFIFNSIKTIERIYSMENRNSIEKYEFVYNEKDTIKTSYDLIMIGTSKDYYFLMDYRNKDIKIFEIQNITNIKINKVNCNE